MEARFEHIVTDPGLPVKAILHTSDAPDWVPPHWHDYVEICYVISGCVDRVEVEGRTYRLQANDILIINLNHVHSFRLGQGRGRRVLTLLVPGDLLRRYDPKLGDEALFDVTPGASNSCEEVAQLRDLLTQFADLYSHYIVGTVSALRLTVISLEICCVMLSHFRTESVEISGRSVLKDSWLRVIRLFSSRYLDANLSVENAASELGYTKEHLSHIVRQVVGVPPKQYLTLLRANHARDQLLNTRKSVLQIAHDSGFTTEKALNRAFKRIYGLTPAEYRKAAKEKEAENPREWNLFLNNSGCTCWGTDIRGTQNKP
ncbi:AraC family transcriptional regulator [Alicyclobacillus vulcanalis]|uniref:AraC-type DNA-binding protein n=1 Tax=Alicyclobacillus vulcanalis TaxID=252246 RepID=A0A1N7PC78_9BACL|nr:AraC family transcriptional regulator [Alicyclobacillus vulcanalis]SIT08212.1 AraC-type DNA-binding protein [Alicyclobacillus vulcanalis]